MRCLRLILCTVLLVVSLPGRAHTLSVSHLDIVVPESGALTVELDLALRDLVLTLPVDANRDDVVTWGELVASRRGLEELVVSGVGISSTSGACALRPVGLATRQYEDGAYATVRLTARCRSNDAVQVRYGLLFDQDPQHRALVTVHHGEAVTTEILHAGSRHARLPVAGRSPFFSFLREGIHHILIGYDHLAFLISLLLPAALLRVGREWQPASGLRQSFMHVLGIVTAFTVSHSITLTLAALGWVTPVSRWIEVAIAASVLLAALNNIWPLVTRRLWVVGFAFGLIHGFGFAGALEELGLPDDARLWALLGFNFGVEIGQVAVVCVLLPVLFLVRRRRGYVKWAMPMLSLLIAALATWWLVQRTVGAG